jgi:hypothetical protein
VERRCRHRQHGISPLRLALVPVVLLGTIGRRVEVGVFSRAWKTARFGVRCFKSVQGFNGDDSGSRVLVLRGTCTKTSRLLSTSQDGSGKGAATTARRWLVLASVVVWCFKDHDVIFISN